MLDHLARSFCNGSVDALLDEVGSQYQAMRFDPWGRRTDAATGSDLTDMGAMTFDHCATTRGFTNHEMLDEVGVVHMNGRIYDPTLARFLQADPYVQFPNNLQNHNRYSYVMDNPLAYTDPTGHFIFTLSAMIFAAQQGITMTTIAAIGAASFTDALVQGATQTFLQQGGSFWQLVTPLGMVPPPEASLSAPPIDWDNYPWMSLEATERFVEGGGTFGDNPDDPAQILRGYKAFHGQ